MMPVNDPAASGYGRRQRRFGVCFENPGALHLCGGVVDVRASAVPTS